MTSRKVREIMSSPPITVSVDQTVADAAELMIEHNIGCLPVLDAEGKVTGILTEADFMAKDASVPWALFKAPKVFGEWLGEDGMQKVYDRARDLAVAEVMSTPAIVIEGDDTVRHAVELMIEHGIHHLPVCEGPRVIGVVTRHDLLRLMMERA